MPKTVMSAEERNEIMKLFLGNILEVLKYMPTANTLRMDEVLRFAKRNYQDLLVGAESTSPEISITSAFSNIQTYLMGLQIVLQSKRDLPERIDVVWEILKAVLGSNDKEFIEKQSVEILEKLVEIKQVLSEEVKQEKRKIFCEYVINAQFDEALEMLKYIAPRTDINLVKKLNVVLEDFPALDKIRFNRHIDIIKNRYKMVWEKHAGSVFNTREVNMIMQRSAPSPVAVKKSAVKLQPISRSTNSKEDEARKNVEWQKQLGHSAAAFNTKAGRKRVVEIERAKANQGRDNTPTPMVGESAAAQNMPDSPPVRTFRFTTPLPKIEADPESPIKPGRGSKK